MMVNPAQQRRIIMGSVLAGILLINTLLITSLFFRPSLLEFIEFSQTLALSGMEIVIVAGIGYFSLIFSHKIMGPAYAIARDLKRLGSGDLTVRTQLRKGDFHSEVAEAFNATSENLCSKIKTVKATVTILQQHAETPESMRQSLKTLLNDLDYFKTEPAMPKESHSSSEAHEIIDSLGMNKPSSTR